LEAEQKDVTALENGLKEAEEHVIMLKAKLAAATTRVNDLEKKNKDEEQNPPIKYPKFMVCPLVAPVTNKQIR
jgi:hypothetical protein